MSDDSILYRAVPFETFPVDRRHVALVVPGADVATVVTRAVSFVLGVCLTPRTIAAHHAVLLERTPEEAREHVTLTFNNLVRAELLQPLSPTERGEAPSSRATIHTLAVATSHNRGSVDRCLASYLDAARRTCRPMQVVLCGNSADESVASEHRELASRLAAGFGVKVTCLDRKNRTELIKDLAAAGCSASVLRFALGEDANGRSPAGADSNALLLATAGQATLIAGDHTLGAAWRLADSDSTVDVIGHSDPREYEFFTTIEAAFPLIGRELDLLAAHELLLGQRLTDLTDGKSGHYDATGACSHMRALLIAPDTPARVRITSSGIAGDGGLESPVQLLLVDGAVRRRLATDREAFDTAMLFRSLRRAVRRPTVTHDPSCDLACAAIDNRELLPPFIPSAGDVSRGFAMMLSACDPRALFGHIPCGVIGEPGELPYYEEIGRDRATTVSEVCVALIATAGLSTTKGDVAARMAQLGRHFSDVASMPASACADFIRDVVLESRCRTLVQLDDLEASAEYPDYWRAVCRQHRLSLLAHLDTPGFFLPTEFGSESSLALSRLRAALDSYGGLLQEWPAIVTAARARSDDRDS